MKYQYIYKIKHIPSGLFYTTVKGRWNDTKTNLSPTGKMYTKKPKLEQIGSRVNVSLSQINRYKIIATMNSYSGRFVTNYNIEFVIVRYKIVESKEK